MYACGSVHVYKCIIICNIFNSFSVPLSLRELVADLAPVSHRWYELGIQFGFTSNDLEAIKLVWPHKSDVCMSSILDKKLKTSPELQWNDVIQALVNIGEQLLADRIELKYNAQCEESNDSNIFCTVHYNKD